MEQFHSSLIIRSANKKTLPILIAQLRSADYLKFDMAGLYVYSRHPDPGHLHFCPNYIVRVAGQREGIGHEIRALFTGA